MNAITIQTFCRRGTLFFALIIGLLVFAVQGNSMAQCNTAALAEGGFEGGDTATAWTPVGDRFSGSGGYLLEDAGHARTGTWSATAGGYPDEAVTNGFSQSLPAFSEGDVLSLYVRVEAQYPCIDGQGEAPICEPNYDFTVRIDDTTLLTVFEGDAQYQGDYVLATFSLAPFADGNPHTLTISGQSEGSIYYVDDVCISPRGTGSGAAPASYDTTGDQIVQLSELLRVIQFYNAGALHCAGEGESSEDGYLPGPGDTTCTPYSADYGPTDWKISLSEILRVIQFYNRVGFYSCPLTNSEDGWCTI